MSLSSSHADRYFDRQLGECMSQLKNKKCEVYDRIPVCCLLDARHALIEPMAAFFSKVYKTRKIPDQWKVSKIIPIHKKGPKTVYHALNVIIIIATNRMGMSPSCMKQLVVLMV